MTISQACDTRIAVCYKPNDADNVPHRFSQVIRRDNHTGEFTVSEIDHRSNTGTGFNKRFWTKDESLAYAALLGFVEVLHDVEA